MDALTFPNAKKYLAETMTRICENHETVIVTRKDARPIVMMALDDYNAMQETNYLLRSPANATNLRESIKQYEHGNYQIRDLIEI